MSREKKPKWMEFLHPQLMICGLCGNSGYVDTRNSVRSPMGKDCGVRTFCICPNGRSIKKQIEAAARETQEEESALITMQEPFYSHAAGSGAGIIHEEGVKG